MFIIQWFISYNHQTVKEIFEGCLAFILLSRKLYLKFSHFSELDGLKSFQYSKFSDTSAMFTSQDLQMLLLLLLLVMTSW
jgi:hypothetical protein